MEMKKKKSPFMVFFLVVCLSALGLSAAMPASETDIRELVREYHEVLKAQKERGQNVSKAEELDRQSREAMARGEAELAARLLTDAIGMMKGSSAGPKEAVRQFPLQPSTGLKTISGNMTDSVSKKSPFGIFGPYQFMVDSREIMNHEKINSYLLDLGVKWVQEMPMGIENVPSSINIYSRVGREGGARPPHVDYDLYKSELRKSLRQFKDRVKYWEVDTEPGGLPPPKGWKKYEKEYAIFLKETYGVIKRKCPDCMVVLGGTAGIAGGRREDSNAAFVRRILDYEAKQYFDVFSFKLHHHKAADYGDLKNKMEIYNKIFSDRNIDLKTKAIFLETGIYDGNPCYGPGHPLSFVELPPQTEFQQAAGLVKSYVFAIAQGVDKVFWNEVLERRNFGGEKRNPFNHYGLVHNPLNDDGKSHKKLAYYTYKKMVELLEGSDWKNIVTVKEDGGIFVYRFNRHGKVITVAWNDRAEESEVRIAGFNSIKAKVTYAVPDKTSGLLVLDYSASFKEFVAHVEENVIRLKIGGNPLYIEEIK